MFMWSLRAGIYVLSNSASFSAKAKIEWTVFLADVSLFLNNHGVSPGKPPRTEGYVDVLATVRNEISHSLNDPRIMGKRL